MELEKIIVPPIRTVVDNVIVDILEVIKLGDNDYHVTCIARFKDISTSPFFINATSNEDFRAKLKVEVAKLKMFYYLGGKDFALEVVRR